MIRKISDFNCFDDKTFLEIQNKLNKKSKFAKTLEEAFALSNKDKIIKKNSVGYTVENKDKIDYKEAMENNMFKRVAWGEFTYSAAYTGRTTSVDGKYSFDDGAIWKVTIGEDGKEYLTKTVDDDDNLVRVASKKKKYVNKSNMRKIAEILDMCMDDKVYNLLENNNCVDMCCPAIEKELVSYIQNYITEHKYIEAKEYLDSILQIICDLQSEINSLIDVNDIIDTVCICEVE